MNAFNYSTQRWADGIEGARLLSGQMRESLALLQGPRGEEYARFQGCDREATIAICLEALNEAQNEIARSI